MLDGLKAGHGHPTNGSEIEKKYPGVVFSQFSGCAAFSSSGFVLMFLLWFVRSAELMVKKFKLSRDELDSFAAASHAKAAHAIKNNYFKHEVIPVIGHDKDDKEKPHTQDEGVRPETTLEALKKLKPLAEGGSVTAATSSQVKDCDC